MCVFKSTIKTQNKRMKRISEFKKIKWVEIQIYLSIINNIIEYDKLIILVKWERNKYFWWT